MADSMYSDYGSYGGDMGGYGGGGYSGGGYSSPVSYGSPTFGNDRIQMSLGNDPWETYNYGTPQGIYQGNTLPESPEQTAIRQQLTSPQSFYAPPPSKQADDLARYNEFLKDQFIDPNSIGTAKLYTDPATGKRKMDVPSIRQEEAAALELERDKNYVNRLARYEMEAVRDAGNERRRALAKGETPGIQRPKPSKEVYDAQEQLEKALGSTYSGTVAEQRQRYLNAALASGGYKPIRNFGVQSLQTQAQPQVQQVQPIYDPQSARYGGPQTYSSNGFQ